MSDQDMRKYIDILNREKPTLIIAYVQSIYEIAKFAKENKIKRKIPNDIRFVKNIIGKNFLDLYNKKEVKARNK